MNQTSSAAVLFALLLVPTGIFLVVRATVERIPVRLGLVLLIAVLAGSASYYLAVNHGWRPTFKGGGRLNLDPLHLGVGHAIIMLVVFALIHFRLGGVRSKKQHNQATEPAATPVASRAVGPKTESKR